MKSNKMKRIAAAVLCGMLLILTACSATDGKTYGAALDPKKGEPVALAKIFADPKTYEGKNVILQGETAMFCRSSGCWVMLKDGADQLLVQFFTFTVRPDVGSKIRAQGVLKLQNEVPYLAADGLELL
ncbi:MAG: hypothetical protein K4445_11080 [Deltaproteobacteria bacterium]|nr:hypothetical protein [Syntrophaceae bacterium]